MKARACALFVSALLALSTNAFGAVATTKFSLSNSGWTDLGVGPMLLSFQGLGVFAVGDTTPTLSGEGFSIRAGRSFPLKTTSHVWATAAGPAGVSAYVAPIGGAGPPTLPPTNSVPPVASGALTVGSTLSCSTGTWTNSPTSYAYTWRRGGTPISGATSATYVTVSADGGTSVGCSVVASNAIGNSSSSVSNTLAIAGSGCPAATNYLARTTGGAEGGNAANITTLICGLVTDGVITGNLSGATGCGTFLDALYILAQQNAADSLLNLCGTSYGLTTNGTFTSYVGYSAFTTGGMVTGFFFTSAPSPKYTLNSAHIGAWIYAISGSTIGVDVGDSGNPANSAVIANYNGTNSFYGRINETASVSVTTPGTGLLAADRSSSVLTTLYWDGIVQGTHTTASVAFTNSQLCIGYGAVFGASKDTISEANFGGTLGATLNLALYTRLRTYMTAVGVP